MLCFLLQHRRVFWVELKINNSWLWHSKNVKAGNGVSMKSQEKICTVMQRSAVLIEDLFKGWVTYSLETQGQIKLN